MALLGSVVSLATTILFLVWTYRADKNLRAFGTQGLRFTPGWAVGYFFVPIMGLYRPYQVFREIWRASDPAPASRVGQTWQFIRAPALLMVWWVCSIIDSIIALLNATQPAPDATVIVHFLNILAAVLTIPVVRRITSRQERTAAAVTAAN